MTRQHDAGYTPAADPYAAHRCPLCRHIRYADEQPGDPCRWCDCANHAIPGDERHDGLCLAALQDAGHLGHGGLGWTHTDAFAVRCHCGERIPLPRKGASDAPS